MKKKHIYRVTKFKPLSRAMLRREWALSVQEVEVFACQWRWLSEMVALCVGGSVTFDDDDLGITELGSELADVFCKVYNVKTTAEAFWPEPHPSNIKWKDISN